MNLIHITIISTVVKNPIKEMDQPSDNKRLWNAVLGCSLKNNRMISLHFHGQPFDITVIQVYAPTNNAEEAEVESFYEDLQGLLELIPQMMSFSSEGTEMQK